MQEYITYLIIATSIIITLNYIYKAIKSNNDTDCSIGCNSCAHKTDCKLQAVKIKSKY